jgi:hypothetical protein
MAWAKQGPAVLEKATALLESIKGLPKVVMSEILDTVAPVEMVGVGRIPRRELEPNQPMQMKGKGEDSTIGPRRNIADHEKARGHTAEKHTAVCIQIGDNKASQQ